MLFAAEIIYLDRILYRTPICSAPGAVVAYALNNHSLSFASPFQIMTLESWPMMWPFATVTDSP